MKNLKKTVDKMKITDLQNVFDEPVGVVEEELTEQDIQEVIKALKDRKGLAEIRHGVKEQGTDTLISPPVLTISGKYFSRNQIKEIDEARKAKILELSPIIEDKK